MKELENNELKEINGGCLWSKKIIHVVTKLIYGFINRLAII